MKNLLLTVTLLLSPFILFAQTSYTWDGSVDTDFATADNWTPSGVPGSGDNITIVSTSNDPILDGNRTVNNLTMTSGTLKLATYDVTTTGTVALNGGIIENGSFLKTTGNITFSGTEMDCEVDVDAIITGIHNTEFKKKASLASRYNNYVYTSNNIFSDSTYISRPIANYLRMGNNVPDTFLAPVTFYNTGYLYLGYNSSGNYFADDVTFENSSTVTNRGITIGYNASSSCRFEGDIILNTDSSNIGPIYFSLGTNEHDGNLLIGSSGYHGGLLTLKAYEQIGTNAIDLSEMDNTSTLTLGAGLTIEGEFTGPDVKTTLYSNCHFKGRTELPHLFNWYSNGKFDEPTEITLYGNGNRSTGGNVFRDSATISWMHYGDLNMGVTTADTFLAPLVLTNWGNIYLGYNSTGNYFADDVTFYNRINATNKGIHAGKSASSGNRFEGDIIMNANTGLGRVYFYLGTNEHDGNLLIGSEGYKTGALLMKSYTQLGTHPIDLSAMDSISSLTLYSGLTLEGDFTGPNVKTSLSGGCTFKGKANFPNMYSWGGCRFEKRAVLNVSRPNATIYTGNNMFLDSAFITRPGNQLRLGHNAPDTFLAPVSFTIENWGTIYIGNNTSGNYYADAVTLNNRGTATNRFFYIGPATSSGNHFAGDITMNVDSTAGNIYFWLGTNQHDGVLKIGPDGYHSGTLYLKSYLQTGNGTIDLSGIDHNATLSAQTSVDITADFVYQNSSRNITLNGATFRGDVTIESPSLPVTNCDFHGTTSLEKTGGTNNLNKGNVFHGATTIENSSTSNYQYWGYSTPDTFLNDLTLINRSSQILWMNYFSTGQFGGDITLDGDSARIIRFGSSTAGRVAVFDGSSDQHLNILEEDLNVQAYRLQVDKSDGQLKVNNDVSVTYELALTDGVIECQNDAVITLADGVEPTGTDASHIEGAVKKVGNDAYTFPVGRNGHYRPIGISAPSNATDAYTAKYLNENVHAVHDTSAKEITLSQISTNDYWTLTRDAGTSDVEVTLSWDDMTCEVTDLAELLVAGWDGTAEEWVDYGSGSTTGNTTAGAITTNGNVSDFVAYALATDDSFDCVPCTVEIGGDTTIWETESVVLGIPIDTANQTYNWSPGSLFNDSTAIPSLLSPVTSVYVKLEATNANGCVAVDYAEVQVENPSNWSDLFSVENSNYYEIVRAAEAYYYTLDSLDDASAKDVKKFNRWRLFWENKVDKEGEARGSFSYYLEAQSDLFDGPACSSSTYSDWELIGDIESDFSAIGTDGMMRVGAVFSIAVDPDDADIIYAGTLGSGLWKTIDGGTNWANLTDNTAIPSMGILGIEIAPYNSDVIYCWTGTLMYEEKDYSMGVIWSNDAGLTWYQADIQGVTTEDYIRNHKGGLAIYPATSTPDYGSGEIDLVYLAFEDQIYKQQGTGTNRSFVSVEQVSGVGKYTRNIAFTPNGDYLFAAFNYEGSSNTEGVAIYKSEESDFDNFSEIPTFYTSFVQDPLDFASGSFLLATTPARPNSIYYSALVGTNAGPASHYGEIDATSETELQSLDFGAVPNWSFAVHPSHPEWVYAGGVKLQAHDLILQTSYTTLFNVVDAGQHDDWRSLGFSLNDGTDLICGNDGGVTNLNSIGNTGLDGFQSPTEFRSSFDNINGSGLNISQLFGVDVTDNKWEDPNTGYLVDPNLVIGGNLDNGTFLYHNNQWQVRSFFDAYDTYIDESSPNNIFGSQQQTLSLLNSTNGARTNLSSNNNSGTVINDWVLKPNLPYGSFKDGELWTINRHLYTNTTDFSTGWSQLLNYNDVVTLANYGGGQSGECINVHPLNQDVVYISFGGPTWGNSGMPKLLRTSDRGASLQNWVDLTDESVLADPADATMFHYRGIKDVVLDPTDPDRLWVVLIGFDSDNSDKSRVQYVYKNAQGKWVWEDFETTDATVPLPNWPINSIVYEEGTNDGLYVGMDVGVYYTNADIIDTQGWVCYNQNFPASIVQDLEISYCRKKIIAATYGRAVWESPLYPASTQVDRIVTEDETWDFFTGLSKDLIIEQGVTLTIKDRVNITKGHKIIVKPGAKLIVDGGELTNNCGDMWHGIEVWGDPDEVGDHILPSAHGILELKNGALIEHAVLAVYLGKEGDCCDNSGGIVRSEGGTTQEGRVVFRNNRKHVAIGPYQYGSHTKFEKTDFICDGLLQDQENYPGLGTQQYVSIWGQKLIKFTDCLFKNTITYTDEEGNPGAFGPYERGTGIRSIDADYDVVSTGTSPSETSLTSSRFIGLDYGIIHWNLSHGNSKNLKVKDSYFGNCWRGIATLGGTFDRILDNTFDIPSGYSLPGETPNAASTIGIYTFGSRGFRVDGNVLEGPATDSENNYGSITWGNPNALIDGGRVYDNDFEKLEFCTQTEWDNAALQISCNGYTDGTYDWMINPVTEGAFANQGSGCNAISQVRAGNKFFDAGDHIWSVEAENLWTYFGNQSESSQVPNEVGLILVDDCPLLDPGDDESCDASTGGGGDPTLVFRDRKRELDVSISDKKSDQEDIHDNLDSLKTNDLLTHIADSTFSKDSLASELAYFSPLSDTVLLGVIARQWALNENQFIEAFVPNSPVSPKVAKELYAKMDDYKVEVADTLEPLQAENPNATTVTTLKRIIDGYQAEWNNTVNEVLFLYASDSSVTELTRYLEDSIATNESQKLLVGTYVQLDSIAKARTALDSVKLETVEDTAYVDYYDLMLDLKENTETWFDMDATEKSLVDNLAESDYEIALYAQAVLVLTRDSLYRKDPEIYTPPAERLAQDQEPEWEEEASGVRQLDIFPNPFRQQFTVQYVFEEEVEKLVVEVYDVQSKLLVSRSQQKVVNGLMNLDLSCCAEGTYLCRVMADGHMIETRTLIHSK